MTDLPKTGLDFPATSGIDRSRMTPGLCGLSGVLERAVRVAMRAHEWVTLLQEVDLLGTRHT